MAKGQLKPLPSNSQAIVPPQEMYLEAPGPAFEITAPVFALGICGGKGLLY